jgi:hypothetical protein
MRTWRAKPTSRAGRCICVRTGSGSDDDRGRGRSVKVDGRGAGKGEVSEELSSSGKGQLVMHVAIDQEITVRYIGWVFIKPGGRRGMSC